MDKRYEDLLQYVQRPARYIGEEVNSIVKDWDSAELKIALVFPDVYDIGMSHLGIRILYHVLNSRPNILCERVFAPWVDMEQLLRSKNLPIVSLENKRPLNEFDIIGFSLSHELNYTNVLNILDLSGIPLRSKQRMNSHPLIIAGGPCAFNPEPMSEFMDLFLIGDGEDAILDIADCYLRCIKDKRIGKDRKIFLKEFSKLEGVYAPGLYSAVYENGAFQRLVPAEKGVPAVIKKRLAPDLERCFYPTKQIVSYIPLVHDRVSLEIMRGCPHRCRFCQATAIYSPKRLRSKDTIMRLAHEAQNKTGHNEISLLSLSTSDYPRILKVLETLVEEFKPKGVSISLPSLRTEKGIEDLPPIIRRIKRTGFTFAPEVGSEKLKRFINKNINNGRLLESVRNVYEFGWKKIKLYFMIGFSGEDNKDLDALIDAAAEVADIRPKTRRGATYVTLSISSFVPKPHTPFQWEAMASGGLLREKIEYIKRNIKSRRVKVNTHNVDMSILEGVFSRGDRRLSGVIEAAFLEGARFDNWSDLLNFDIWRSAFRKYGIDFTDYLKGRRHNEPLPWEHINAGVSKDRLAKENALAHRQAVNKLTNR